MTGSGGQVFGLPLEFLHSGRPWRRMWSRPWARSGQVEDLPHCRAVPLDPAAPGVFYISVVTGAEMEQVFDCLRPPSDFRHGLIV